MIAVRTRQQTLHVLPRGAPGQLFASEYSRTHDRRREATSTPTALFCISEENAQHSGVVRDRRATVGGVFALARNRSVDVPDAYVAEWTVFLPKSLKELFDPPSVNADGGLRQTSVADQLIAKLVNHMCIRARRCYRQTQTVEEGEPILGI